MHAIVLRAKNFTIRYDSLLNVKAKVCLGEIIYSEWNNEYLLAIKDVEIQIYNPTFSIERTLKYLILRRIHLPSKKHFTE